MGIPVNFDGIEPNQAGGTIAEGDYLCVIERADEKTSSKGTPGIEVQLKIIGGEFDGRYLWDNIWITAAAMGMARYKLECAGVPIPAGQFQLESQALERSHVNVTVRHEQYDGKPQARVKGWAPPVDAPAKSAAAQADDDIPF